MLIGPLNRQKALLSNYFPSNFLSHKPGYLIDSLKILAILLHEVFCQPKVAPSHALVQAGTRLAWHHTQISTHLV